MHAYIFFKKILEDMSPFCGATDIPVLDFWWRLPWVSSLACFVTYVPWIPEIHLWYICNRGRLLWFDRKTSHIVSGHPVHSATTCVSCIEFQNCLGVVLCVMNIGLKVKFRINFYYPLTFWLCFSSVFWLNPIQNARVLRIDWWFFIIGIRNLPHSRFSHFVSDSFN